MIDRSLLRILRSEIDEALKTVGERHKLAFKVGDAKFAPDHASFKLEINAIGENGEAISREANDFKMFALSYGLKPEDLGRGFRYGGASYEIVGLNIKAPRYPVQARNLNNGKTFRFPLEVVKHALGQSSPVAAETMSLGRNDIGNLKMP